jgi:hypothetical protein
MILNRYFGLSALPCCLLVGGLAAMGFWAAGAPSARAQASTAHPTHGAL